VYRHPDRAKVFLVSGSSKARDCSACPMREQNSFCALSPQMLTELNRVKTPNQYKRGQILFYEGNPATGVFCIRNGKIKLYKNGSDGKETILKIAKGGDILGYAGVLTNQNHDVTAEVLEDAEVCYIDKPFLTRATQSDPALGLKVIQKLGQELVSARGQLTDFLNKDVRHRLIELLLQLQKDHGKTDGKGILINVRLTRQELGSMMCATPETVIRLLSSLEEEGLVELDGKQIYLKNLTMLTDEVCLDT
jgi:CRP/FNR family transcriptional regulator, polysaccharide utilization system transcription regulator